MVLWIECGVGMAKFDGVPNPPSPRICGICCGPPGWLRNICGWAKDPQLGLVVIFPRVLIDPSTDVRGVAVLPANMHHVVVPGHSNGWMQF